MKRYLMQPCLYLIRTKCFGVGLRVVRYLFPLCIYLLGTFLVVIIWTPNDEYYRASNNPIIQSDDGVIGYTIVYYSRLSEIQIPHIFHSYIGPVIPPFAMRTVTMTGHKRVDFIPVDLGDEGRTKICWSGFVVLFILSVLIFYLTYSLGEILKYRINKKITEKNTT
ncbi:MAG: hypothetical protein LBC68_05710 [Prevotellaceae bacterium]|nr:hypothetical protein [Prevotellaceae bacterium]